MTSHAAPAPTLPAATCTSRTFRLEYGVTVAIRATPARIWGLLTDAAGFPRWNSTVAKLDGTIADGQHIAVQTPSAPGRTFKLKVTAVDPQHTMVWRAGFLPMFEGVRTYTLTPGPDGTTVFSMVEVFRGAMLPLIKRALPDFGPMFATYAADLQREAETVVRSPDGVGPGGVRSGA